MARVSRIPLVVALIVALAFVVYLGAAVAPAHAASHVGSFQIGDRFHVGGHAGGDLLSGGAMNGGGELAYKTPDGVLQQATVDFGPGQSYWFYADQSDITLCFIVTGTQGYVFAPLGVPQPLGCFTVPVNQGQVFIGNGFDPYLYAMVVTQ